MELAKALAFVATGFQLWAFWLYNRKMIVDQQNPNTSTWLLWAVLTILNFTSYSIASGDIWKSLLPMATSFACIGTCIFALRRGKFKKLSGLTDMLVIIVGLTAAIVWKVYQSAALGNVTLQLAIVISFIPTFRDVLIKDENPLPWLLWGVAYAFLLIVVILRWQHQPWDLVYPLVGVTFHLAVALLSRARRSQKER